MNPELHNDPTTFSPERYLSKPLGAAEYVNTNDPLDRDHFTYGAGRRVCPGIHVAERSLYINIVRTLWGFTLEKARGTSNEVLEPETAMVRGFLSVPVKYPCRVSPRSDKHVIVMRAAFNEAEAKGI
jgi:cytochrome P450